MARIVVFHLLEGESCSPASPEQRNRLLSSPAVIAIEEKAIHSLQCDDFEKYLQPGLVLVLWNVAVRYQDVKRMIAEHHVLVVNDLRSFEQVIEAVESVEKEKS